MTDTQIYKILQKRLMDFNHLHRELQQAFILSGIEDKKLVAKLQHSLENIMDALERCNEVLTWY